VSVKTKQSNQIKVVSLLLSVGGALGVLISLVTEATNFLRSGMHPSAMTALMGLFAVIFGWSVWTGVELWRGKPQALRSAKILFAAQIPQVTLPVFAYHFYTGFILALAYTQDTATRTGFEFQIGSSIGFTIPGEVGHLVLGVNVVAIVALICLMRLVQVEGRQK
jgi:hypothetical protein